MSEKTFEHGASYISLFFKCVFVIASKPFVGDKLVPHKHIFSLRVLVSAGHQKKKTLMRIFKSLSVLTCTNHCGYQITSHQRESVFYCETDISELLRHMMEEGSSLETGTQNQPYIINC